MSRVTLRGLRKSFGAQRIIDGLDLDIADGEFFVLLGPSGCGKTTSLRCIAGLEEPDAGRIAIGGTVVAEPERGVNLPPNKRGIGMVFQSYALWPHMSVERNLAYPLRARGWSRPAMAAAIAEALDLVGLSGYGARYPAELSGGQQQRVALARAVVANPELVLFDEPLSNLDAQLRVRLRHDLRRIQQRKGYTAVYVTHDQSEALALSDRLAIMRQGRIVQIGTPAGIFRSLADRFVAQFVGFDNFLQGTVTQQHGPEVSGRVEGWTQELRGLAQNRFPAGTAVQVPARSANGTVEIGGIQLFATLSLEEWGTPSGRDAADGPLRVRAALSTQDLVVLPLEAADVQDVPTLLRKAS